MTKKTIVETNETYEDEKGCVTAYCDTGLYLEGDTVIFKAGTVACDDADTWSVEGRFPVKNYRAGIKELLEKGHCVIQGMDLTSIGGIGCQELHIQLISQKTTKDPKEVALHSALGETITVNFSGFGNGMTRRLNWDINLLQLPE